MLSTTLLIIKLSVDNMENSKRFNLILVSCIRIIPPQDIRVFHKFYQKIDQKFFNFKKINASITFSRNKQFTKINTCKILK